MAVINSPSQEKFLDVLRDIAEQNGFIDYEIKFDGNRTSADGYVGNIIEAQIVSTNRALNLLIKSCNTSDKIRTIIPVQLIFERETYMYENVFPTFKNFEIERGVKPLQFAPAYYNSYNNNQFDAIILTDLKRLGYWMHDKKSLLNDEHVKLVLKQYAQFHATSLAYKDQNPLKFKELVEPMEDFFLRLLKEGGFVEVFAKQMKKASESLDPEDDREVKNTYEKFMSELESFLEGIPAVTDEYSVIAHGDCWKNNMMFKYGDVSEISTPTEVRMFDYQISRASSPMLDIVNFFYSSSTKEVIDNMQKYLTLYYDCLSKHLQNLGSDPEKVYPRSVMMNHWRKLAWFGLPIRACLISIILSEEKDRKGISDILDVHGTVSDVFDYPISDKKKYDELNRHIIMHFVKNDFVLFA